MAVHITGIDRGSLSAEYGILPGDDLISINGEVINDMMDLQFFSSDLNLKIVLKRDGKEFEINMEKSDEYDSLGLEFETYLIDKHHSCKNKCIFCFIDQLPKGMRPSLYFKDDDERLSFLFGNYITLTNLSRHEIDRIKKMKISPINISVHAVEPELRVFMMKNPRAAEINSLMDEFYEAGITMNTQVVLCKNINDGEHLKKTVRRMERLYPQVHSVSIVPFGMTRYRDGLEKVESYTKEECRRIIEQVNRWTEDFVKEHNGERLVYLSDEFYMRAEVPLPPAEYYCDYAQLENGVGLVRNFMDNFLEEVEYAEEPYKQVKADMAVGEAMYPIMCQVFQKANEKLNGALDIKVHKIVNNFFGGNVWVTGLITAQDLIRQVQGKLTSDTLLLCADMLDSENEFFLDDKTPEDVEKALGVKLSFYPNDGVKMAQELLGTEY